MSTIIFLNNNFELEYTTKSWPAMKVRFQLELVHEEEN